MKQVCHFLNYERNIKPTSLQAKNKAVKPHM